MSKHPDERVPRGTPFEKKLIRTPSNYYSTQNEKEIVVQLAVVPSVAFSHCHACVCISIRARGSTTKRRDARSYGVACLLALERPTASQSGRTSSSTVRDRNADGIVEGANGFWEQRRWWAGALHECFLCGPSLSTYTILVRCISQHRRARGIAEFLYRLSLCDRKKSRSCEPTNQRKKKNVT